jgi:hypothetical protein
LINDHEKKASISYTGLIEFVIVLEEFSFVVELGSIEGGAGLGFEEGFDVFNKLVVIYFEVGDGVTVSDSDFHI